MSIRQALDAVKSSLETPSGHFRTEYELHNAHQVQLERLNQLGKLSGHDEAEADTLRTLWQSKVDQWKLEANARKRASAFGEADVDCDEDDAIVVAGPKRRPGAKKSKKADKKEAKPKMARGSSLVAALGQSSDDEIEQTMKPKKSAVDGNSSGRSSRPVSPSGKVEGNTPQVLHNESHRDVPFRVLSDLTLELQRQALVEAGEPLRLRMIENMPLCELILPTCEPATMLDGSDEDSGGSGSSQVSTPRSPSSRSSVCSGNMHTALMKHRLEVNNSRRKKKGSRRVPKVGSQEPQAAPSRTVQCQVTITMQRAVVGALCGLESLGVLSQKPGLVSHEDAFAVMSSSVASAADPGSEIEDEEEDEMGATAQTAEYRDPSIDEPTSPTEEDDAQELERLSKELISQHDESNTKEEELFNSISSRLPTQLGGATAFNTLRALPWLNSAPWVIILCHGGYFAGGVFIDGKPVVHKSFHRYVVRKKQGGKQSNQEGKFNSAGSMIRKAQEKKWNEEVKLILDSWRPLIDASWFVFYAAPSPSNRKVISEFDITEIRTARNDEKSSSQRTQAVEGQRKSPLLQSGSQIPGAPRSTFKRIREYDQFP